MQFPAPPAPAFPAGQAAVTSSRLRYEDLTQDGRLLPIAMPYTLAGLWREVLDAHPSARLARGRGVVPLLTRMTLASSGTPIRVDEPVEAKAGFELAHARDAAGEVARLYLNCWADIRGASGRLFPPIAAGPLVLAGQLFAEHSFTRPFAPPDQRRVLRFETPGLPTVPDALYLAPAPQTAGERPAGAQWVDELAADPAEVCFGIDHTDSNQHVNSLVYIRVFLEGVQRHLAARGRSFRVRSRVVDIAYRKPCFAGDRVRAHLRLFEAADGLGVAGHIAADGDAKPRCYARVLHEP